MLKVWLILFFFQNDTLVEFNAWAVPFESVAACEAAMPAIVVQYPAPEAAEVRTLCFEKTT